ncbi:MAG: hypothetical protein J0M15_15405 [Deltaproteobacteria bacterium]|jgi:hypothetical protein|nr:hypothetical protein [Deltaproteobacteria bacterium]
MNKSLSQNVESVSITAEKKRLRFSKYFATSSLISWILVSIVFTISVSANAATKIK